MSGLFFLFFFTFNSSRSGFPGLDVEEVFRSLLRKYRLSSGAAAEMCVHEEILTIKVNVKLENAKG